MLDLRTATMPSNFHIIDKDQVKDFLYTREGTAKLRTAIGELDTVIVASRRSATDGRVLRMWFAPVARLRAGAGRAQPRRQARVRDAHQEREALAPIPGVAAPFRSSAV